MIDTSKSTFYNVSKESAEEYIEYRSSKGKRFALTQRGFERAMMQAQKCESLGITPDEAIELCIDKCWIGVTYEYVKAELSRRSHAESRSTNQISIAEATSGPSRSDWAH